MASFGRIARLLARTAASCALVYAVCLPIGGGILRVITAAAGGVLRLVERPVVLTSLASHGDRVVIATYLSGSEQPLVTWQAGNLPIFLVATLGLALAAPASNGWQRLETVLLGTLASVATMIATVALQLQVTASNEARARLGLELHDRSGDALLASANQGIGIAMMLLPAAIFAFAYVRFRAERAEATPARPAGGRRHLAGIAVTSALACSVFLGLVGLGRTTVDPRPGLARVVELNPAALNAHLALTYYDTVTAFAPLK